MSANLAQVAEGFPYLASAPDGLPIFTGDTYEDHLDAWNQVRDGIESRLWTFAAIAASLDTKYKDKTIERFAHDVRLSARYIRELAQTYRAFENGARAPILSFKHHTIAARASNPVKAIEKAEANEWSCRQLDRYVETGLEPGETAGINATALAQATTPPERKPVVPNEDLESLADRALIDHLMYALKVVQGLKTKCPRPKFVSDVYDGWEEELNDHLEQLTLDNLREKVIKAWHSGRRQENQIASITGIPMSEIHAVMRAYERDGVFEKIQRRKTQMAKGTAPWIWHLVGEPVGSDYERLN